MRFLSNRLVILIAAAVCYLGHLYSVHVTTFAVNPPVIHVGSIVTQTITAEADDSSGTITLELQPSFGFTFLGVQSISAGTFNNVYPAGIWTIPGPVPVAPYNTAGTIVIQYVVNNAITTDAFHTLGGTITQIGSFGSETFGASLNFLNAVLTTTITSSTPGPVYPGNILTLTITVANSGTTTDSEVQTVVTLPAGLTFVNSSTSQGSYNSGTSTWTIGSLPVSTYGPAVLELQVMVNNTAPLGGTLLVSQTTNDAGNNNVVTASTSILVGSTNFVAQPSALLWKLTAPHVSTCTDLAS